MEEDNKNFINSINKRDLANTLKWVGIIGGGLLGLLSSALAQKASEEERAKEINMLEEKLSQRLDEDTVIVVEREYLRRRKERQEREKMEEA